VKEGDKRQCTLRHRGCMLDHHDVSRHQVRGYESRQLIVGEIPRLDAKQYADGAALDGRLARMGRQCFRCQECFGMLSIVVDNVRAESNFTPAVSDQLAHFKGDETGKVFGVMTQQIGRF
jgi:hypothetical protein